MKTCTPWRFFLSLAVVALTVTACDSDSDGGEEGIGPPENITRVVISVETGSGANLATYTASKSGAMGVRFKRRRSLYSAALRMTIELFDDTITNASERNLTDEIRAEREGHRFFFTYSAVEGGAGRVMALPIDLDSNNLPVGLEFQLSVTQGGVAAGGLRWS